MQRILQAFFRPVITSLLLTLLMGVGMAAGQDPAPQTMVSSKMHILFDHSPTREADPELWDEHFSHYVAYVCNAPIRAELDDEGNVQCTGTFSAAILMDNERIQSVLNPTECPACLLAYETAFDHPIGLSTLYVRMAAVTHGGQASNPLSVEAQWQAPILTQLDAPDGVVVARTLGTVTIIVNTGR